MTPFVRISLFAVSPLCVKLSVVILFPVILPVVVIVAKFTFADVFIFCGSENVNVDMPLSVNIIWLVVPKKSYEINCLPADVFKNLAGDSDENVILLNVELLVVAISCGDENDLYVKIWNTNTL